MNFKNHAAATRRQHNEWHESLHPRIHGRFAAKGSSKMPTITARSSWSGRNPNDAFNERAYRRAMRNQGAHRVRSK